MATPQDTRSLTSALGPDGTAVKSAVQNLEGIYRDSESLAPVNNCYRFWVANRPFDADTSPELFVRHTCLSMLCRLMAYRFLESRPSERDLWEVMSGDYFAGAGLSNFLGEDFFSWPFFRLSMGIGDDALSIETARSLFVALESLRLYQPDPELLSSLYRQFRGRQETVAIENAAIETGAALFDGDPALTCIVPYCGDGTVLARAVRSALNARVADGQYAGDAMLDISGQFIGMTSDPLAANVASLTFLLALGEEVLEPHPPILVPVYMAHGINLPTQREAPNGGRIHVIDSAGGATLPDSVAADPLYLDWLFGRLPNYLRGAALRLRAQPQEVAVQEVLNAWYNYLTSPKTRTPIPDPLSPDDADVMVGAARTLILQYVSGSGPGPLHLVRNAPAPLFASRRPFDILLWPTELAADDDLQRICAARYLGEGGRVVPG